MNPNLEKLQAYPFEKLQALKEGCQPPTHMQHISMSIGEPKHAPPAMVRQAIIDNLDHLATYPTTFGIGPLREAMAAWASQRFSLRASLDPLSQIIPVSGTREALFSVAQALIEPVPGACVLMPNPFYQIYEGAALLAGATPYFLNCTAEHGYIPNYAAVPDAVWRDCQLLYLCNPGNPTGHVTDINTLKVLIELASRYNFVLVSDECYSEIYADEDAAPPGLLQACAEMGVDDYAQCLVFHSLSKRSNLPGLRSGFVAGDAGLIKQFLQYRTYHGCALPVQHQYASIAAWNDEAHVRENRQMYREKFKAVLNILGDCLPCEQAPAGFYLWPAIPGGDDLAFTRELFETQHVTVLPGSFLARDNSAHDHGGNPGSGHVRMALVAPLAECVEAAERIKTFMQTYSTGP